MCEIWSNPILLDSKPCHHSAAAVVQELPGFHDYHMGRQGDDVTVKLTTFPEGSHGPPSAYTLSFRSLFTEDKAKSTD